MFICTFKHTPETVDCKYCLLYYYRRCTAKSGCPYLAERIEAGAVDYGTVVRDMFRSPTTVLRWRLVNLIEDFPDTMWENKDHEKRFFRIWTEIGSHKRRDTPQFFAALYLLTSNEDVYCRAYNAFSSECFDPSYIRMSGIEPSGYALVQAAKSICLGTDHFTVADLSDCEAIGTDAFRVIVNALLIARYGRSVMSIRGKRQAAV